MTRNRSGDSLDAENKSSGGRRKLTELPDEVHTPGNVFVLSDVEATSRLFHLRYSTKDDAYYRYGSSEPAIRGWKEGAFTVVNMQRYHAIKGTDIGEWAYLTRKPKHHTGSISWFIDFENRGLVLDQVYALTYSRTLSGGSVTFDMRKPRLPPLQPHAGGTASKKRDSTKESKESERCSRSIVFAAYLDGGLHRDERPQTQLFYQDFTDGSEEFPFDLLITFIPEDEQPNGNNNRKELSTENPSFPPRPTIVPSTPVACTCPKNGQKRRTKSSKKNSNKHNKENWCYSQDEKDVLETSFTETAPRIVEPALRTVESSPRIVERTDEEGKSSRTNKGESSESCRTSDNNTEAPTSSTPAAWKEQYRRSSSTLPKTTDEKPVGDRTDAERGTNRKQLTVTEKYSEVSVRQSEVSTRGDVRTLERKVSVSKETTVAWKEQRVDQETLVEMGQESRPKKNCVIL